MRFILSATFSSGELDSKLTILATRVLCNVKLRYFPYCYILCFYFTSDLIYQGIYAVRG